MFKKIIFGIIAFLLVWILFIWGKYYFFYPSYSQEDINTIFKKENLKAPVYDSINIRGYSIHYLTNKANDDVITNQETRKKKPYLFLIHDSGKNSGYFLDYFKNKEINKIFHIIAVDRIGFGKSHFIKSESEDQKEFGEDLDYVTSVMPKEILKNEGQHLEEVRIVTNGCAGLLGLKAYNWADLTYVKVFMFYPETEPRFFGSIFFSKLISSPFLSFLFPRDFVSKHQDLLLMDDSKGQGRKTLFENAKISENKGISSDGPMFPAGKGFKSIFFIVANKKAKEQTENIIETNNFLVEEADKKNIYKDPGFVLDKILLNDFYTLDFNRIRR
ncbi:hypothetical protein [Chryseobacterium paludis]|uniref:hypothetical protein n=1 Tax=Chryseobacterium paludis TaxID=2956784 RepID=UPI0021BE7B94|nr:hypothetical protein [Chryseobacterium paludis]